MTNTSNSTGLPDLPINACLGQLLSSLEDSNSAVLIAPPGAGKSTRVPLALLDAKWRGSGKLIMLEPRRIAARSVAAYMAKLLHEPVGKKIGYRVRMDTKVSSDTLIEVVTEGVFTRMVLDDPSLEGVNGVIFDEFHERSLDGDFGLALALDVQAGLREDLRLLVMSATLDGAAVGKLMDSPPTIQSEGRSFPVEHRYLPREGSVRLEEAMASAIRKALIEENGSILCFLPGQREILRTLDLVSGQLPQNTYLAPLYGALSAKEQDLAVKPAGHGFRKIVLATNIAETSLTIDGVTVVIDGGYSRVPRFEPATGLTQLKTERASLSSINQRAGRAGRTAPGIAVRLWHEGQNGALSPHQTSEILEADLTSLVLALANFGIYNREGLRWLDLPPKPAWDEATTRLSLLGALDQNSRITELGRKLERLPFPPHLASMISQSKNSQEAKDAIALCMLIGERGLGGNSPDLTERLDRFKRDNGDRSGRVKSAVARVFKSLELKEASKDIRSAGALLCLAFPDRISVSKGKAGRYQLSNGRAAFLDETSPLAKEKYLVVCDLQGTASGAKITSATAISKSEIEAAHADRIFSKTSVRFDEKQKKVIATTRTVLGKLVLKEQSAGDTDPETMTKCLISGITRMGLSSLPWDKKASAIRGQLSFLNASDGESWPNVGDDALLSDIEEWLAPFIIGKGAIVEIMPTDLISALLHRCGFASAKQLTKLLPTHFSAPTGSSIPIRYESTEAILPIRVQELYGLSKHPDILDGKIPLVLELLSPAHRPIQKTSNLPEFWKGSWKDVRAEMRGRYPRHPWPENPADAKPTTRAKPKGQ